MTWLDIRGPDGRLLFRLDPERLLIEIMVKGHLYTVDIAPYVGQFVSAIEITPLLLTVESQML